MGCMLRSDRMSLCDMFIQPEAAFGTLSQLGEMACVEFLDMNVDVTPFEKQYVTDLCRCVEMERKLLYIKSEIEKDNIIIPQVEEEPRALQPNEMLAFENILEKWEFDVVEMSTTLDDLRKDFVELSEMYYVLDSVGPTLGNTQIKKESLARHSSAHMDMDLGGHLAIITGVVTRKRCFLFEIMLWRVSRGNIYYRQADEDQFFEDSKTGEPIGKVAFLAICQGDALAQRMHKICAGFHVNLYPCPINYDDRMEMLTSVGARRLDLEHVIKKSNYHRCKALMVIRKQWRGWMISVQKARAIYSNLNLFNLDITKKCLIGQCWIPDLDIPRVQKCLETTSKLMGTTVPSFISKRTTKLTPPTFHRTNKFTKGFQALINAYGDSIYRELNPGLYTIVTFPFLFALMFGDIGHGIILLIFAVWMVVKEKKFMNQKSTNEIWNIFFGGRYVMLLLGIFSIYAGFIYNDCFSKSFNLFGSYWHVDSSVADLSQHESIEINPSAIEKNYKTYYFGLDPIWSQASNKIMVENSIKMKISIIFGIVHMLFGIFLSLADHIFHKRYYAIFFEFIPQIVFMVFIFLWLVFMIYYKWFNFGAKERDIAHQSGCAPQILILFIDMVLFSTTKSLDPNCDAYMFENQQMIQMILVLIALVCVPVLLLGTPLYLFSRNKKKREKLHKEKSSNFRRYRQDKVDFRKSEFLIKDRDEEEESYHVSFSELMIHQGVSTIEYVLSTISHTASYLRLWALSLAHSELSHMLWHMVLAKIAILEPGILSSIKTFVTFAIWAAFSVSILVVMEGLSAFLHTLRLHWVEFMSKFYLGGGLAFKPFSFEKILSGEEKADTFCKKKVDSEVKSR